MFGVYRSLMFLRRILKTKLETHNEWALRIHVRRKLFFLIYFGNRMWMLFNDVKSLTMRYKRLAIFDVTHCATWQNPLTKILFFKEYIKNAFEWWGTVWQRIKDENTVVWRNYSEQNLSITLRLRNFETTIFFLFVLQGSLRNVWQGSNVRITITGSDFIWQITQTGQNCPFRFGI